MAINPAPTLALDDIQGNLAGFNKDFQRFVFLAFPSQQAGQSFLAGIASDLASCSEVLEFNDLFRKVYKRRPGRPDADRGIVQASWLNIAFSFAGLQALGAPGLDAFPGEFSAGMRAAAPRIGDVDDSAPAKWVAPFNQTLHAVALLAADELADLQSLYQDLHARVVAHGVTELAPLVDGQTRPGDQRGREHFGFRDGISQPAIIGLDIGGAVGQSPAPKPGQDAIAPGEFVLGAQDPTGQPPAPPPPLQPVQPVYPGPAPTPPPTPAFPGWAMNGSYLVFRRLRQNVQAFNAFITQTAQAQSLSEDVMAAKLVGRFKSGAPLELTPDEAAGTNPDAGDPSTADPSLLTDAKINDFTYGQDADGHLVPRAAHIRKTNPRDQQPPAQPGTSQHRLLRRGIPYGPELAPNEPPYPGQGPVPDTQDRGLLFLCYQASIARQFEFVQTAWVNSEDFPQSGDGRDPIISQDTVNPEFTLTPQNAHLTLARWVITTGGEYFFAPSISAVGLLAGQPLQ
ncbi:MAG: Dyp-type peroxidase [Solirubrobacteraceae bacterium]